MGYMAPNGPQVGYTQPNAVKKPSGALSNALGFLTDLADMSAKDNAAKAKAEADAAQNGARNLAVQDAVDFQAQYDEYRNTVDKDIEAARASGDQAKLAIAISQGKSGLASLHTAYRGLQQKRVASLVEQGLADEYFKTYNEVTGTKLNAAGVNDIVGTPQEIAAHQEYVKVARDVLTKSGWTVTGDDATDTAAFTKYQAINKEALDAARAATKSRDDATLYVGKHGSNLQMQFSNYLSQGFSSISAPGKSLQQRQAEYEQFKTLGTLEAGVSDAIAKGVMDRNTAYDLLKADTLSGGLISKRYEASFKAMNDAAQEFVTKGVISADNKFKMEQMQSEVAIHQRDFFTSLYGGRELGDTILATSKTDPSVAVQIKSAFEAMLNGGVTNNVEAMKRVSSVLDSLSKKGIYPDQESKAKLEAFIRSIDAATKSSATASDALGTITKGMWNSLPDSYAKTSLVSSVDQIKDKIKTDIKNEFEANGLSGDLTDYFGVNIDAQGSVRLVPRKGAEPVPKATADKIQSTRAIGNLIRAYSTVHGMSEQDAATEIFQTQVVQEQPAQQDKTSMLDLTGLDQADVMDIQSYILELKAKQSRSAMVS